MPFKTDSKDVGGSEEWQEMLRQAHQAGRTAFIEKVSADSNPHAVGTGLWEKWLDGWKHAEAEATRSDNK